MDIIHKLYYYIRVFLKNTFIVHMWKRAVKITIFSKYYKNLSEIRCKGGVSYKMILQHNLPGITSNRNMAKNKAKLSKNLEKLSSGYRINRAGDDAAGLAISEGLRCQIRGTEQAQRNIQDGIGLTETADGAMQEINNMLIRARRLSTQAANGTYNDASRAALQQEIDELKAEINRITASTKFNGVELFPREKKPDSIIDSSVEIYPVTFLPAWVDGGKAMQDGAQTDTYSTTHDYTGVRKDPVTNVETTETGTVTLNHAAAKLDFSKLDANNKSELIGTGFYCTCITCNNHYSVQFTNGTGTNRVNSGTHYVYEIGIDNIQSGEDLVNAILTGLGKGSDGIANPMNHYTMWCADPNQPDKLIIYDDRSADNMPSEINGLTGVQWSNPQWRNPYFNTKTSPHSNSGRFGRGVAYEPGTWAPPPEPPKPDIYLQVGPSSEEQLGILLPRVSVDSLEIENVSVMTIEEANNSIDIFEEAIDYLDLERGRIGAYQNRLEHTYQSQAVSFENLTQAESRIRDTDMAEEFVDYTKNNILFQSAQSMLAHANALPQNVMQLFG